MLSEVQFFSLKIYVAGPQHNLSQHGRLIQTQIQKGSDSRQHSWRYTYIFCKSYPNTEWRWPNCFFERVGSVASLKVLVLLLLWRCGSCCFFVGVVCVASSKVLVMLIVLLLWRCGSCCLCCFFEGVGLVASSWVERNPKFTLCPCLPNQLLSKFHIYLFYVQK